ncbi:MAG: Hpt domain-containing protein [Pseudomonadota bacterium]
MFDTQDGPPSAATAATASGAPSDMIASNAAPHAKNPPIDHAHLERYTLGNRALELEVLRLFIEQAPCYLSRLREADGAQSWRYAAHTLKGSARAVGAVEVAHYAQEAEVAFDRLSASAQRLLLDELDCAIARASNHIESLAATAG